MEDPSAGCALAEGPFPQGTGTLTCMSRDLAVKMARSEEFKAFLQVVALTLARQELGLGLVRALTLARQGLGLGLVRALYSQPQPSPLTPRESFAPEPSP
jgi:hypothetical protein